MHVCVRELCCAIRIDCANIEFTTRLLVIMTTTVIAAKSETCTHGPCFPEYFKCVTGCSAEFLFLVGQGRVKHCSH